MPFSSFLTKKRRHFFIAPCIYWKKRLCNIWFNLENWFEWFDVCRSIWSVLIWIHRSDENVVCDGRVRGKKNGVGKRGKGKPCSHHVLQSYAYGSRAFCGNEREIKLQHECMSALIWLNLFFQLFELSSHIRTKIYTHTLYDFPSAAQQNTFIHT